MFCILEGVDGGGKSTAAKELVASLEHEGLSVELLHRGVPERSVYDEYQLDVQDYRPGQGRAIVADRWHMGQPVYGPLYRGRDDLGVAGFRFIELFLKSRGAVTVLIENDPAIIRARLLERGEDYLKLEHVEQVLASYHAVMAESITGVITTAEPDVEEILKFARFAAQTSADLAPYASYIGQRTPRVLLVGEKRSNQDAESLAAFRPDVSANSSTYLLEALPATLWRETGICNAYEEKDLLGLLDVLAGPPVIALGRAASDRLTALGVEHAGVPHPAYMRRFKAGREVEYGQYLYNLIGTQRKEFSWPH